MSHPTSSVGRADPYRDHGQSVELEYGTKFLNQAAYMSKKWFSALVLEEATHPDEPVVTPLFEAKVLLIQADSEEQARDKAEHIGESSQHEYQKAYGQRVAWVFRDVLDIKEIIAAEIEYGAEVYYVFLNPEEQASLCRTVGSEKNGS